MQGNSLAKPHWQKHFNLAVLLILLATLSAPKARADYVFEKLLHEFFPASSGPADPSAQLTQGLDGNFYGTTGHGGNTGNGTIYRLATDGSLTVLFSFLGTNGANPSSGLIQTSDGLFYGTTIYGNNPPFDSGSFFKVTTNGVLTALFYFSGTNGSSPSGKLAQGTDGIYGTTRNGGDYDFGTLYRITTNGTFTLLHSFDGTNDGCYPTSGLISTSGGNFFGLTSFGGNGLSGFSGYGTVFKFNTNGTFTPVVSLNVNNVSVKSGLTLASDGLLYGVAGKQIFKMTTSGMFNVVATFDGTNGNRAFGGVTEGKDRNFYGITSSHIDEANSIGRGTIFKMTTNGELKTIFYFNGTNAVNPFGTFLLAQDGNLYAALADEQKNLTLDGNAGAILRLVEPPKITITRSVDDTKLTWTSFTNGVYRLETIPSFDTTNWTALSSDITATGNTVSFTNGTTGAAQEFYRVLLLP